MIPEEYRQFGLVDIPGEGRPHCFRVWSSPSHCTYVPAPNEIKHVYWSGESIIAVFENHTRIYHGLGASDYQIVYS